MQAALGSSAGTTARRAAGGGAAAGSRPCRLPSAALPGRQPGGRLQQGGLQLAAGLAGCPQQLCRADSQEGGCRAGCSWQQALQAALSSSAGTTSRRGAAGGPAAGSRPCRLPSAALPGRQQGGGAAGGTAAGSRPCRLPSAALPGRHPGGGLQGGLQLAAGLAGCPQQLCRDDIQEGGLQGGLQLAAGLAGCPQQLCRDDSKEGGLQGVLQLPVGPGAIARRGAAAGGRPCRLHTAALRRGQYKRGPEGRGEGVGSSPYRLSEHGEVGYTRGIELGIGNWVPCIHTSRQPPPIILVHFITCLPSSSVHRSTRLLTCIATPPRTMRGSNHSPLPKSLSSPGGVQTPQGPCVGLFLAPRNDLAGMRLPNLRP